MPTNFSVADGLTPIITFVSMVVLGIIISEYVLTEPGYKLIIIIFSLVMAVIMAGLELRSIINRRNKEASQSTRSKLTPEQKKRKLAKYVADLFDEDIPFENEEDQEITDRVTEN